MIYNVFFNVYSHSFLTITIFMVIVTAKPLWGIVNKLLYCIVLYCIVLYCIVLYCIVLYLPYQTLPSDVQPPFTFHPAILFYHSLPSYMGRQMSFYYLEWLYAYNQNKHGYM